MKAESKIFIFLVYLACFKLSVSNLARNGKKTSSKMKSKLQNSNLNKVELIYFGPVKEGNRLERFYSVAKHLGHEPRALNQCSEPFIRGFECISQLNATIMGLSPNSLVVILNAATALLNATPMNILDLFSTRILGGMVTNQNHPAHGCHIIATRECLTEKLIKSSDTQDMLQISDGLADVNGIFFGETESWDPNSIEANLGGKKGQVVRRHVATSSASMVYLQKEDFEFDKFNHFANLLFQGHELEVKASDDGKIDLVFILVAIPPKALFLEEFLEGLLAQDYPKNKIMLHISCQAQNCKYPRQTLRQIHSQGFYRSVYIEENCDNGPHYNRASALEAFKKSASKYFLYLHSAAILYDKKVISKLVAQRLPIVAPSMNGNNPMAITSTKCTHGWNDTYVNSFTFGKQRSMKFVQEESTRNKKGQNFVLYEHRSTRNLSSFQDEKNFWIPRLEYLAEAKPKNEHELPLPIKLDQRIIKCCFYRAESLRYIYLVRRSTMLKFDPVLWSKARTDEEMDDIFSSQMKSVYDEALFLFTTHEEAGELVILNAFPENKRNPELFRALENHRLWEKRYIKPDVQSYVRLPPNHQKEARSFVASSQTCNHTFYADLFSARFLDEFEEEANQLLLRNNSFQLKDLSFESDWMAILDFYLVSMLCSFMVGPTLPTNGGHMSVRRYNPGHVPKYDYSHPMTALNLLMPLQQFGIGYEGSGIEVFRSTCTMKDIPRGVIVIFPGDLTYTHRVMPVLSGKLDILSTKLNSHASFCYMKYGAMVCPGFETNR